MFDEVLQVIADEGFSERQLLEIPIGAANDRHWRKAVGPLFGLPNWDLAPPVVALPAKGAEAEAGAASPTWLLLTAAA